MSKVHYHFDHVGSYLRPQALKEAREKFANGEISQDELLKVQDELVKELVHHEVENGLQVVSDGEFGRSWWHLDFLWNLTGFEAYQQEDSYKFHGAKTRTTNVRINGKIAENPNHPFYRDFEYLKSVTPEGITPKVTIPSPSLIINRDHRSDLYADYYDSWTDFLDDLAKAYHDTIQHFYDLGARYVQLDDTTWGYLIQQFENEKNNPEKTAELAKIAEDDVYTINKALEGLPEDLTLATHSPYIINHLNLLLKAFDKGVKIENAALDYHKTEVYVVEHGMVKSIKVQNAHLINTDYLSDDINEIYNEYDKLDEIQ